MTTTAAPPRRREALVDAVFRCVVRDGLEGTTTSVIAAEAGVSRGVIHYYFRDKLALYEAAFERVLEGFEESLRRHPIDATLTPAEQLRALVRLGLPVTRTSRERITFWIEFMSARTREPALQELNARHTVRWRAFLCGRLAEMQAAGAIPPDADLEAMAMAILAFSDGLGLHMAAGGPNLDPAIESALALFAERLTAASPAPSRRRAHRKSTLPDGPQPAALTAPPGPPANHAKGRTPEPPIAPFPAAAGKGEGG